MTRQRRQHRKAERLHRKVASHVKRGLGDQPCKPRTLRSFEGLARQVFEGGNAYRFTYRRWYEDVRYNEMLVKASQLRAITGSRRTSGWATSEQETGSDPLSAFCSTLSAAMIVFFVSAHFAMTAPPALRQMMGG